MAPKTASFDLERAAGAERGRVVVGVDEVGRGPWAGPVVAAAAWLDMARLPPDLAAGLRDSKTLGAAARERARQVVADYGRVALGQASVAEIDRLNILRASLLAMARAVTALAAQLPRPPDWVLVDGNRLPDDLPCPGQAVIKGDQLSHSIAAAVPLNARDAEMARLTRCIRHGWARNAGGTAEHRAGGAPGCDAPSPPQPADCALLAGAPQPLGYAPSISCGFLANTLTPLMES